MILGSIITTIIEPFAKVFGWVLAGCFSFSHSYGISIILLTLAAMVLVFPLTRAGTRSMMRMQLLQPELMKIRNKYKMQPGMPAEERQAARLKLNEEMMALYRENGVNPTGGCLPMFLQFPIFIVLYNVIRGMTRVVTVGTGKNAHQVLQPLYIPHHTQLYQSVISSHGVLESFGLNLTDSVRTPGPISHKIPYILIILIAVVLQYISIWQITNRNPSAAQANPQMQAIQKFMPLIFVFLYIVLPAGVGVYFIVSSLFRIGQQEYMYKHDPKIVESVRELHKRKAIDTTAKPAKGGRGGGKPELGSAPATDDEPKGRPSGSAPPRKGFRDRLRDAAAGFQGTVPSDSASPANGSGGEPQPSDESSSGGNLPAPKANAAAPASRNGSSRTGSNRAQAPAPLPRSVQNRSRDKRPRRP